MDEAFPGAGATTLSVSAATPSLVKQDERAPTITSVVYPPTAARAPVTLTATATSSGGGRRRVGGSTGATVPTRLTYQWYSQPRITARFSATVPPVLLVNETRSTLTLPSARPPCSRFDCGPVRGVFTCLFSPQWQVDTLAARKTTGTAAAAKGAFFAAIIADGPVPDGAELATAEVVKARTKKALVRSKADRRAAEAGLAADVQALAAAAAAADTAWAAAAAAATAVAAAAARRAVAAATAGRGATPAALRAEVTATAEAAAAAMAPPPPPPSAGVGGAGAAAAAVADRLAAATRTRGGAVRAAQLAALRAANERRAADVAAAEAAAAAAEAAAAAAAADDAGRVEAAAATYAAAFAGAPPGSPRAAAILDWAAAEADAAAPAAALLPARLVGRDGTLLTLRLPRLPPTPPHTVRLRVGALTTGRGAGVPGVGAMTVTDGSVSPPIPGVDVAELLARPGPHLAADVVLALVTAAAELSGGTGGGVGA
ncbi:hypothetical protein I4F81_001786 [Pyropia yezoensis]|uniref:Uncharacterized protein n=1 Tax=Pyropia yezoensis TaxID=2788 RepID=A0ACC3BMH7_PYRYE|nr:hypothetical protein I4F81_001786 [Neopyropia yezoensis]